MFPFYPFIYEKYKKEEFQQIPLYIEDYFPLEEIKKENIEEETIIIIDLL
jgi:hypothetical protein